MLVLVIALTLAASYLLFFLLFPLARGAIYEPSTREQTDRIAEAAPDREYHW